ncbi:hypothetical protein PTKIN_Ptkin01aG0347400 [Pterospermum kingtungense]
MAVQHIDSSFMRDENFCVACGEYIWVRTLCAACYWCQPCNVRIDFGCAKLLPTLKHKSHHHLLAFFGEICLDNQLEHFKCNVCHRVCKAESYRCVECDFNLHLRCVPMPFLKKNKCHIDRLVFKNSVVEDDSEEYYCDICEKERNPKHPAYCGEKCTFIAHIECVLHDQDEMDDKALMVKEMEHNEGSNDDIHMTSQQFLNHKHLLKFYEVPENPEGNRYYCNGYRLVLNGPSYICTKCPDDFYAPVPTYQKRYCLHEQCAKLPHQIQLPFSFHPSSLPPHQPRSPDVDYRKCNECGDICLGFIYLCEDCNFQLDVKCSDICLGFNLRNAELGSALFLPQWPVPVYSS